MLPVAKLLSPNCVLVLSYSFHVYDRGSVLSKAWLDSLCIYNRFFRYEKSRYPVILHDLGINSWIVPETALNWYEDPSWVWELRMIPIARFIWINERCQNWLILYATTWFCSFKFWYWFFNWNLVKHKLKGCLIFEPKACVYLSLNTASGPYWIIQVPFGISLHLDFRSWKLSCFPGETPVLQFCGKLTASQSDYLMWLLYQSKKR